MYVSVEFNTNNTIYTQDDTNKNEGHFGENDLSICFVMQTKHQFSL